MARIRTYRHITLSTDGRSFYSKPRKRTGRVRIQINPSIKADLAKERDARKLEYNIALKAARDAVQHHAVQLHKQFGGHTSEYYETEIMQRGRLERGRRNVSRWNAFVRHELQARNAGMSDDMFKHIVIALPVARSVGAWTTKIKIKRHQQRTIQGVERHGRRHESPNY